MNNGLVAFIIVIIFFTLAALMSLENIDSNINNDINTNIRPINNNTNEKIKISEHNVEDDLNFKKTGFSKEVYSALNKVGNEIGLPIWVWYPIVKYESDGNPSTRFVNKFEDSRGLFQVNTYVHKGANPEKLYDPYYNAKFQMPELKKYMDIAISKSLTGVEVTLYVAKHGQRPNWQTWIEDSIRLSYKEIIE